MTEFKQLDIHWINLEPAKGAETKKLRPCVIVQGDLVNIQSRTLIVAPLLPNHIPWPFAVNLEPSPKKTVWTKTAISTLNNYALLMFQELAKNKENWKVNILILLKVL